MSIEWYNDAMQEADDEDKDFLGCPSCLGMNIECFRDEDNEWGHREKHMKCNDCATAWSEVTMPERFDD